MPVTSLTTLIYHCLVALKTLNHKPVVQALCSSCKSMKCHCTDLSKHGEASARAKQCMIVTLALFLKGNMMTPKLQTLLAGAVKRDPIVVGKPEEFMLANIAETFKLERHQICMVGDRLDTDILFGQDGGLTTMLVLSGKVPNRALKKECFTEPQRSLSFCSLQCIGQSE